MLALTLTVLAAAPFPLPSVDDKPLAVTDTQTTFRLPMRFPKVRAFYDDRLGKVSGITRKVSGAAGNRVLTITNADRTAAWRSATVTEKEMETVVTVVPVLRVAEERIEGQAGPLVQFVFGRSPDVDRAVRAIDHTEQIRR